jgi:hypothetical protein
MSRYVNQIKTPFNPVTLYQPLSEYLLREGFSQINYKGVRAWKKGMGILTAPQYVILSNGPDYIQLEAFLRFAILPGVYAGEMGITGFGGAIPKRLLKKRVEAIEQYLYSLWQPKQ